MSFNSQLEKDLQTVFLNSLEFGEKGEIAGHESVPMVVESLALEMAGASFNDSLSVNHEGVTVYVSASDVPDNLLAGRKTTFRHEEWFVLSCACDCGMKTIQLYRETV